MAAGVFYEKFSTYFKHDPTSDQVETLNKLYLFFKDETPYTYFILNGYAGTGKTSLLGALVQTLDEFKVKTKLLAPTGRAAKVLSYKAKKEAFTIHKQIYRRKNQNDDFGTIQRTPNHHTNTVFIVDEASMIGDYTIEKNGNINSINLLEDLLEYVFSGKNCKLIVLGDVAQLPPVGSELSPALDERYMLAHFHRLKIYSSQLTQVVRQSHSSNILDNATILRCSLDSTIYQWKLDLNGDLHRLEGQELQYFLEDSYSGGKVDDCVIITRSNKWANRYNNEIRSRILWYEDELCVGDRLMVLKNNYYWLGDDSKIGFIANGESIIVRRVMRIEEIYGFRFAHLLIDFPSYDETPELEVIVHLESLQCDGASLSRDRIKQLFFAVEEDYLHEKNKKKRYDLILKDRYFNALQVKFSYAVTCHKAQGGQWNTVFIDQGFKPEEITPTEHNRWLYTALTRATETVYLINFPETDFTINQQGQSV